MKIGGPVLGLLLVLASIAPAVAQDDDLLTPAERQWLADNGPIRYAPDPDYPPFEFLQADGTVDGVNIDFLNRISRNLDVNFEIVVYDNWTVVLEKMQAREVQLLGSLAQTPEREEYMDFIGPYMEVGEVFYVRTDGEYPDIASLAGQKVAVVASYAAAGWLAENHPEMVQVPVDDIPSGIGAVSSGTVAAFFENVPVTGFYIRQLSVSNVQILGEPLYYSPANWGLQKDEPELHSIMTKGLASIPLGEQTKVFEYWTGYDLGVQRDDAGRTFSPLSLGILGALVLIVLSIGAFSWSLRRQVARRTSELQTSRDQVQLANEELEQRVQTRTRELKLMMESEGQLFDTIEKESIEATRAIESAHNELSSRYHGVLRADSRALIDFARMRAWQSSDTIARAVETTKTELVANRESINLAPLLSDAAHSMSERMGHAVTVSCAKSVKIKSILDEARHLASYLVAIAVDTAAGTDSPAHAKVEAAPNGGLRAVYPGRAPHLAALSGTASIVENRRAGLAFPALSRIAHRHGGEIKVEAAGEDLVIGLTFSP